MPRSSYNCEKKGLMFAQNVTTFSYFNFCNYDQYIYATSTGNNEESNAIYKTCIAYTGGKISEIM